MTDALKQARKALARDAADETLVLLWHELEAARLAGDDRALRTIERLAGQVSREGDESQQREAERLLETMRGTLPAQGGTRPATLQLDGEVHQAGEHIEPADVADGESDGKSGFPIGTLVWILLIAAVVVINVLGQDR